MRKRSVKSIASVLVILALCAGTVAAEDAAPWETFPSALGGFYGPFSGSGLHYHRWMGDTGFHVSGGIIYVPYSDDDFWYEETTLDYSIGGEFQRRVYGEAFASWFAGSLYLFVGGQHRGYVPVDLIAEGYEVPASDPPEYVDPVYSIGAYQAQVSVGAGIGIELIVFRHFSIPIEFGYGATWTVTEPSFAEAISVGPNAQIGLRYRY